MQQISTHLKEQLTSAVSFYFDLLVGDIGCCFHYCCCCYCGCIILIYFYFCSHSLFADNTNHPYHTWLRRIFICTYICKYVYVCINEFVANGVGGVKRITKRKSCQSFHAEFIFTFYLLYLLTYIFSCMLVFVWLIYIKFS